jgi:hypothetical protein
VDDEDSSSEDESVADTSQNLTNQAEYPTNQAAEVSSPESEHQEEAQPIDQAAQPIDQAAQAAEDKAAIARLQEQLAYEKLSNKVSKNSSGRKVKAKEMSQEEKMWKARVKHAVFDGTWHMNKFCNEENRLVQLTRKTMRFMQLTELEGLTDEQLARKEMKWIVANKDLVPTSLITIRNAVGGGIRKEYIDRVGRPVQHEAERWKPDFYAELTI